MNPDDVLVLDYAAWVLEPSLPLRATPARSSCFICGTPRTGTWLLSGLLESTGVAGHPHEYFWRETRAANQRNWRVSSSEYVSQVLKAGTTDNGVFACKVMWDYNTDWLGTLRRQHADTVSTDREVIEQFFPQPRFVWVRRNDVVAQAVSWALAIQTGHWHHWDTGHAMEPTFDFDEIDALVQVAESRDRAWRRWFDHNRIAPLEVRFEDLVKDHEGVTRQVLAFLNIEFPDNAVVTPRTLKTADALGEEWVARYRVSAEP